MSKQRTITVFEHEPLKAGSKDNNLKPHELEGLQKYHGEKGCPFFSLIHNGVKFSEYVGVLKVGGAIIEVLPKADRCDTDLELWRERLIDMLKYVGQFKVHAPNHSDLKLKANNILDLYFELFINEIEILIHQGLIKKYRKTESNLNALKGTLRFNKHITENIVHKERFYVSHTTYDKQHIFHQIIFKAIKLIANINTNNILASRIGNLLLNFPEHADIRISESTFNRLVFDRKSESYRESIDIARLLLLNYHPDVSRGKDNVLALMFDMNLLWERFVYKALKNNLDKKYSVIAQNSKPFWKPAKGNRVAMRPDIVIRDKEQDQTIVLDTKWKNLYGNNPSPDDLRQMYTYSKYYNAFQVALIYPGSTNELIKGSYFNEANSIISENQCANISLKTENIVNNWALSISNFLVNSFF